MTGRERRGCLGMGLEFGLDLSMRGKAGRAEHSRLYESGRQSVDFGW